MYYYRQASNAFKNFVFRVESQKIMTILSKQNSKSSPSSRNCCICRSTPPETSSSFPVKWDRKCTSVTSRNQRKSRKFLVFFASLHICLFIVVSTIVYVYRVSITLYWKRIICKVSASVLEANRDENRTVDGLV